MTTKQRLLEREPSPLYTRIERTPEETEALLAEIRRNREERMRGRKNITDAVKAVRQIREGRSIGRVGHR